MDLEGDAGLSSNTSLSDWIMSKERNSQVFTSTMLKLIRQTQVAIANATDVATKALLTAHLESLQLHKLQNLRQSVDVDGLKIDIANIKADIYRRMDEKLPETTMRELLTRLRKESELA
ncbi:hypothetical protein ACET3Z_018006 [Daucus carota]